MRKLQTFALVTSVGLVLAIAPTTEAKAKVTKPSAPTIVSVRSSDPVKGKVNVTVKITLPTSNGGSKITESKVTAAGKSCVMKKLKTSCTLKGLKADRKITIKVSSKNKEGYGAKSPGVSHITGDAPYTAVPTATATPATPATPKVYAIGDIGPGGGKVFMLPASLGGKGGNYYYEAAPASWYGTVLDPQAPLCIKGPYGANADLAVKSSIGEGYLNTQTLEASCSAGAANLAGLYAGGGKTDWLLPSRDELNELFQNKNAVGDLNTAAYWSSTGSIRYYPVRAWARFMGDGFETELFEKTYSLFVRPIRAFQ